MRPTSATGPSRAPAERGFTLVEVMVALLVMALLTSAVLLTVPDPGPRLADEAERLAGRLAHAREAALTANRPVEMVIDAEGYAFREQRRGVWVPLDDGPFARKAWPEGLQVAVESAEGRSAVRFDSTGGADPATVRLANRRGAVRLSVDAQGEVRVDDRAG
ncbi:GspH/FimT family pseudopilin [Phenylobacterium sp.]|uniref:GspH/FimT family pseudopilin n=1 Tax=Phenylobacterium sp. TaxID=1871053 RepID=UPI0035B0BC70